MREQGADSDSRRTVFSGIESRSGCVIFTKRNSRCDAALPFSEQGPQVILDAAGGLIALLRRLGGELHDDAETARGTPFTFSQGGVGCPRYDSAPLHES